MLSLSRLVSYRLILSLFDFREHCSHVDCARWHSQSVALLHLQIFCEWLGAPFCNSICAVSAAAVSENEIRPETNLLIQWNEKKIFECVGDRFLVSGFAAALYGNTVYSLQCTVDVICEVHVTWIFMKIICLGFLALFRQRNGFQEWPHRYWLALELAKSRKKWQIPFSSEKMQIICIRISSS